MPAEFEGSTPSVVLRTVALRESDLLVILLTLDHGKLEAIARGARKSRKRFAGGLPAGARGEASLQVSRRGKFPSLAGFVPTADHGRLGRDLDAFAYVNYACELTDRLTVARDPEAQTFAALCQAIEEACAGSPSPAILRRFELALLGAVGLLPALDRCAVCSQDLGSGGSAFDLARGGALCARHAVAGRREHPEVLALARALAPGAAGSDVDYDGAPAHARRGLRALTRAVVRTHLKRPLKSLEFFAELRRGRPSGGA